MQSATSHSVIQDTTGTYHIPIHLDMRFLVKGTSVSCAWAEHIIWWLESEESEELYRTQGGTGADDYWSSSMYQD